MHLKDGVLQGEGTGPRLFRRVYDTVVGEWVLSHRKWRQYLLMRQQKNKLRTLVRSVGWHRQASFQRCCRPFEGNTDENWGAVVVIRATAPFV